MRITGLLLTALFVLGLGAVAPGCDKAKQKAKRMLHKRKCKKAVAHIHSCAPDFAKKLDSKSAFVDQCIKNYVADITHRNLSITCLYATRGNCEDVKTCLVAFVAAEAKYQADKLEAKQKSKDKATKK